MKKIHKKILGIIAGFAFLLVSIQLVQVTRAAENRIIGMMFLDGGSSPITTALDLRVSLWDAYEVRSGDVDGSGNINTSATHYASYQDTLTITPDGNGYFIPGVFGYYKLNLANLTAFPDVTYTNAYLDLEYKAAGAPNTSYLHYDFVNDPPFDNITRKLIDDNSSYYTLDAGPRTNFNAFTLDANNNAATEVKLEFGETLAEFLQWSVANVRFELSDDLYITGNLDLSGLVDGRDIAQDGQTLDNVQEGSLSGLASAWHRSDTYSFFVDVFEDLSLLDIANSANYFFDKNQRSMLGALVDAVVNDFENYADTTAMQVIWASSDATNTPISLDTTTFQETAKAMRVDLTYNNSVNDSIEKTYPSPVDHEKSFGHSFYAKTEAVSLASNSITGTPAVATVPGAPTVLAVTKAGDTEVDLTWVAPVSDGNSPLIRYDVQYNTVASGNFNLTFTDDAVVGATVTGLTNATPYQFRVVAVNAIGSSTASNVVNATPAVHIPQYWLTPDSGTNVGADTTAIACGASIEPGPVVGLMTNANPTCPTRTRIRYTPAIAGTYLMTFAVLDTEYTVPTQITGNATASNMTIDTSGATTSWYYEFCEYDPNGAAGNCNSLGVSTTVIGPNNNNADIALITTGMAGGIIRPGNKLAVKVWLIDTGFGDRATLFYDENGTPGNTWIYVTETPTTSAPGSPTSTTALNGDGEVNLTWTAPTSNGGSAITSYEVQYGTVASGAYGNTLVDDTVPGATVTGLANGTAYQFRVIAKNAIGSSSPSNSVTATPITLPTISTPTDLVAYNRDTQVELVWNAPVSNGNSAITSYEIQYNTVASGNYDLIFVDDATPGATVTGLTNGTAYQFRVVAINSNRKKAKFKYYMEDSSGNKMESRELSIMPASNWQLFNLPFHEMTNVQNAFMDLSDLKKIGFTINADDHARLWIDYITEQQTGSLGQSVTIIGTAKTADGSNSVTNGEAYIITNSELAAGATKTISISRDNGVTWTVVSESTWTDISAQPAGTQMKYKIVFNGASRVDGLAFKWR